MLQRLCSFFLRTLSVLLCVDEVNYERRSFSILSRCGPEGNYCIMNVNRNSILLLIGGDLQPERLLFFRDLTPIQVLLIT